MNNSTQIPRNFDDNYWRQKYGTHPHHDKSICYEDYQSAYQSGHEGYDRYSGKSFDEAETELKSDYEKLAQKSGIRVPWEQAKDAAREAWDQAGTS
ncbi:hypothetical protein Syn7502_03644 (plasmid) [Synechococcus sp. PCC 7502]|uniref:hypothetical protein n=1 Tax=Synechococcus sp. PCC 7502 TaxID=1173263 RepID=UPI00029F9980|nr:hypothetical protein [Synechococcus sp. PCC 7502]AFY75468.1 hypothetical protein Syn7502_03644 [Synechococcus sp. PCC 7502]